MSVDMTPNDGIVGSIKAEVMKARDEMEAEKARLEALIERHQKRIAKIGRKGVKDILEPVGALLAACIGERHGKLLVHRVSGPFGLGAEWYLSLRTPDDDCWAIARIMGGPESMAIKTGDLVRDRIPFPDDLSELAAFFDALVLEEVAARSTTGTN